MSGQRRRRWVNINPALFKYVVFAGNALQWQTAVTAYFSSNQLLLFAFALQDDLMQIQKAVTAYF